MTENIAVILVLSQLPLFAGCLLVAVKVTYTTRKLKESNFLYNADCQLTQNIATCFWQMYINSPAIIHWQHMYLFPSTTTYSRSITWKSMTNCLSYLIWLTKKWVCMIKKHLQKGKSDLMWFMGLSILFLCPCLCIYFRRIKMSAS